MQEIQNTLNHLREYVSRAHRVIEALEALEKTGVISPGTVMSPRRPDPASEEVKPPESAVKSISSTGEKRCKKCQKVKPLDSFALHKECADGHLGTCKECRNAWIKEHRKKQAENSKNKNPRKPAAKVKAKQTGEEPRNYKCKKCGQKFKTHLGLITHMDVQHTKKWTFQT